MGEDRIMQLVATVLDARQEVVTGDELSRIVTWAEHAYIESRLLKLVESGEIRITIPDVGEPLFMQPIQF